MLRRTLRLATLVGGEVAAVVILHRLGGVDGLGGPGADPAGWLRSAAPADVAGGALRVVALACAWWLLASTLLYLAARACPLRSAAPAVGRLVPAAVRRRVDRAVAVSVLASAALGAGLSGVAAAGEPAPPPVEVRDGRAIESFPSPATTTTAPVVASPPPVPPAPAIDPAAPTHHVVAPGESLWTIAATHAGSADVGRYWARVVEVNSAALRSGNPNLIYPGEIVEVP